MRNYSKHFKLDTLDSNQKLLPIIVIADSENTVLFVLSQGQQELYNINGERIEVINCLDRVSNIKVANDFDSKRLKINRLRCSLYNYYDVNTKLSNYINTGVINKIAYLFYKSPTTNVINFQSDIGNYDCAFVYAGEISRLKYDNERIDITAEDRTQIKIGTKKVPYNKAKDILDVEDHDTLFKGYDIENVIMPMTFGKVDKSPVVPQSFTTNDRYCKIILDTQPTAGTFKTSKIPSLLDGLPTGSNNYYLYAKMSDSYVILDHEEHSENFFSSGGSYTLLSAYGGGEQYLFNDLGAGQYAQTASWEFVGFHERMVKSVHTGGGSMFHVWRYSLDELTSMDSVNDHVINNNNNYLKTYYRDTDYEISMGEDMFDTGELMANSTAITQPNSIISLRARYSGRWIFLTIDKGVGENLRNVRNNGLYIGNTFLAANWKLYQREDGTVSSNNSNLGLSKIGWFVAPVVEEWKNIVCWGANSAEADLSNTDFGGNADHSQEWPFSNALAHYALAETDDQFQVFESAVHANQYQEPLGLGIIDNSDPYNKCPIACDVNQPEHSASNYWGSKSGNSSENFDDIRWRNINGKNCGIIGDDNNVKVPQEDFDRIAIFEMKLDVGDTMSNNNNMIQGLKMNNAAIVQAVEIPDIRENKLYASIVGRKNHAFTEQINVEDYESYLSQYVDIPYSNYLLGDPNEINVSTEELLNLFADTLKQTARSLVPYTDANGNRINYTKDELSVLINPDSYIPAFQIAFSEIMVGQHTSAFWNTFYLLHDYILRAFLFNVEYLHRFNCHRDATEGQSIYIEPYLDMDEDDPFGYEGWFIANLPDDFYKDTSYNHLCLFEGDFAKSFVKEIYQYLFQDAEFGNFESKYSFTYQAPTLINWELVGVEDATSPTGHVFPTPPPFTFTINENYTDADLTDEINSKRSFSHDSFGQLTTIQDIINNFLPFLDDLIFATLKTIDDNLNQLKDLDGSTYEGDLTASGSYFGTGHRFVTYLIQTQVYNLPLSEMSDLAVDGTLDTVQLYNELYLSAYSYFSDDSEPVVLTTDGIINRPSDIIMNILVNEMHFGKYDEQFIGTPDYNKFDIDSIEESRNAHNTWKMGFSINKKTGGKRLIEKICSETKSYPKFNMDGSFGLLTIKNSYQYDDIDMIINTSDIIKYKFSQTKREDLITSIDAAYRYDNGSDDYIRNMKLTIEELLPEYSLTAYNDYNILAEDTIKETELRYHTETDTVTQFLEYDLLNNCNPHNVIECTLSLNYCEIEVGDILHIPLINNERAFNIDYSVVSYLHTQPVYPLWIVMKTDLGVDSIKIEAVQLHYLGNDGNHGFVFPDETGIQILGNTKEYNSYYEQQGIQLKNFNYNKFANVDNGIEMPYYDVNNDGIINVVDIVAVVNHVLGTAYLTAGQLAKLRPTQDTVNVITIIEMINIVLGDQGE
jgi:hypothetical protein